MAKKTSSRISPPRLLIGLPIRRASTLAAETGRCTWSASKLEIPFWWELCCVAIGKVEEALLYLRRSVNIARHPPRCRLLAYALKGWVRLTMHCVFTGRRWPGTQHPTRHIFYGAWHSVKGRFRSGFVPFAAGPLDCGNKPTNSIEWALERMIELSREGSVQIEMEQESAPIGMLTGRRK